MKFLFSSQCAIFTIWCIYVQTQQIKIKYIQELNFKNLQSNNLQTSNEYTIFTIIFLPYQDDGGAGAGAIDLSPGDNREKKKSFKVNDIKLVVQYYKMNMISIYTYL